MNKNKLLKISASFVIGTSLAAVSILPFVLTTNDNNAITTFDSATNNNEDTNKIVGQEFKTGDGRYSFWDDQNAEITNVVNGGDVYFRVTSESGKTGTVEVIKNNFQPTSSFSGSLNLPTTIRYDSDQNGTPEITYTVTSIGYQAFYEYINLSAVTIPGTVTNIGNSAFFGCSKIAGALDISNTVTNIGDAAFYACHALSSLSIGNKITSIGDNAFGGCYGLKGNLSLPSSVSNVGDSAFNGCSGLQSISFSDGVLYIGSNAFSDCSELTGDLVIPDSVVSVGHDAFSGCDKLSFDIGNDGVKYSKIDDSNFTSAKWAMEYNPVDSIPLSLKNDTLGIADEVFSDKQNLIALNIPNGVKYIGNNAFYDCYNLKGDVVIPDSVISIGDNTFDGCGSLSSISWWVDENKEYFVDSNAFPTSNANFKLYSNNPAKLSSLEGVEQIKVNVETTTTNIIPEQKTKIGDLKSLSNGQQEGIEYSVEATYINFPFTPVPTNAFEIIGTELWYTNAKLIGDVNITIQARLSGGIGYATSEKIIIDYLSPDPADPSNLETDIIEDEPSVIGVFQLKNPAGKTVTYSISKIVYKRSAEDVPADAFSINTSTGVLRYNGTKLTGDVQIVITADDGVSSYNFNPVNISYHHSSPSPVNPDPSELNTKIEGKKSSVIGTFPLNNPVGDVSYTLDVTYVDTNGGDVPTEAFEISSTGVLKYNGTILSGDVEIVVTAKNDDTAYIFDKVTLNYSESSNVNVGAVVGGALGGVAVIGLGGGATVFFTKKKK